MMDLLAAIDLMDGRAVRLVRGDFGRVSDFGAPEALAKRFLAEGARWLHIVDLDAARGAGTTNRHVVKALVERAHAAGAAVEVGGGVRTAEDVGELMAARADRVVLGTTAVRDPALARRMAETYPGAIALALDYREVGETLEPAVEGWQERADTDVGSVLAALDGAPLGAVVATAIGRDGTLEGPDLEGLAEVLDMTATPVVASGGVTSTGDLLALGALRSRVHARRLGGALVGRALVDGTLGLREAIAACEACG